MDWGILAPVMNGILKENKLRNFSNTSELTSLYENRFMCNNILTPRKRATEILFKIRNFFEFWITIINNY